MWQAPNKYIEVSEWVNGSTSQRPVNTGGEFKISESFIPGFSHHSISNHYFIVLHRDIMSLKQIPFLLLSDLSTENVS